MSVTGQTEPPKAKVLSIPRAVSINALNKARVTNVNGVNLGKIEDILVDIETGRIPFAVMSTSGLFGRDARLYAIPWEALKFSLHDKVFLLNITKETLLNAPNFTKNNWPDLSSLAWLQQVYAYYGVQPYWKDSP
jgi:sporulation protein YlmC with PRC-barrel domain